MHCIHCGYLLFNLPRPVCPECGLPFDVCAYRFEPQVVHFACPACDQEYAGNDQRGLPWPREFTCVRCSGPVDASSMRVVPQKPDAEGLFGVAGASPWEQRRSIGLWLAWWRTVKMTMIRPSAFFQAHGDQSNAEAYRFAVITAYLGPGIGMALIGLFYALTSLFAGGGGGGMPLGIMAVVMWAMALLVPAAIPVVGGACTGALIHLALLVLAPQRRSFGHTYRLVQYSMGPTILTAIPVCLDSVGQVWYLVTLILAIRTVHRVSGWVAALAVLWPLMLAVGLGVALVILILAR
ncbi:MAG: hypothetical protein ACYSVY_24545 [Planctomycetota bacterium]|jgi:hypothetical protein